MEYISQPINPKVSSRLLGKIKVPVGGLNPGNVVIADTLDASISGNYEVFAATKPTTATLGSTHLALVLNDGFETITGGRRPVGQPNYFQYVYNEGEIVPILFLDEHLEIQISLDAIDQTARSRAAVDKYLIPQNNSNLLTVSDSIPNEVGVAFKIIGQKMVPLGGNFGDERAPAMICVPVVDDIIETRGMITSFSLPGQQGQTTINQGDGTIELFVKGAKNDLAAVFTASDDAVVKVGNVVQVSGVTKNNFTSPVSYTVTSESGVVKNYSVTAKSVFTATITETHATANITNAQGEQILSGDDIYEGEILTLGATAESGYENPVFTIGGQSYPAGSTYTVSGNTTFVLSASETFQEASWATIKSVLQSGDIPTTWTSESTKTFVGTDGNTYTARFSDKQAGRYTYADGSGRVTHGAIEVIDLPTQTLQWNSSDTNAGGYAESLILKNLNGYAGATVTPIIDILPNDLKSLLEEVLVSSSTGGDTYTGQSTSVNKIFLLAMGEVINTSSGSPQFQEETKNGDTIFGRYDYYVAHSDGSSRIKNTVGTTTADYWWFRSTAFNSTNYVNIVDDEGGTDMANATSSNGVSFAWAW